MDAATDHLIVIGGEKMSVDIPNKKPYWLCKSCSYHNGNFAQPSCAICGLDYSGKRDRPTFSLLPVTLPSSRTVPTNTSPFSRISRNDSLSSCRRSLATTQSTCSQATRTSASTKIVSNCCYNVRPTTSRLKGKRSFLDTDESGTRQPERVSHDTAALTSNTPRDRLPHGESNSFVQNSTESHDDDVVSISSQCTYRQGSFTTSSTSVSTNADGSLDSSNSRRKVPHEEPSEMQPRFRRSRRPQPSYYEQESRTVGIPTILSSVHHATADHKLHLTDPSRLGYQLFKGFQKRSNANATATTTATTREGSESENIVPLEEEEEDSLYSSNNESEDGSSDLVENVILQQSSSTVAPGCSPRRITRFEI